MEGGGGVSSCCSGASIGSSRGRRGLENSGGEEGVQIYKTKV